jgi:hypothetical protein
MSHVGQDCILQAGFSTGLLALSSRPKSADEIDAAACKAAPQAQPTSSTSGGLSLDALLGL